MAHTLALLEKLGKSDLARLVMGYQNKFDTVLNNINSKLLDLKNKFKDMVRIMNKKESLKNAKLDGTGLPRSTSLFINPSLCSYYKYLWSKCKALWSDKLISSFWVSNGSLGIKLGDDTVKSVSHKDDLKALFPGNLSCWIGNKFLLLEVYFVF